MTENPDRTESLFAAAAALPADARTAYLDRECAGDSALRERLVALLRAHERAGHLLDEPPTPDRTGAYVASASPGAIIAGRYKLLEEIGEGGMGAVWVAEQTEPVKRKVAIKLIKAGMDSHSVLARFEAERQALAMMDHPNIAKVFDGGLTEAGRPFFVMEYVKGVPITEYCDSLRLSVADRLQLFVQVCSAVQHAHQKGIIHRDLKPSNILVAPYDDRPVPKVIDFGLAKAMHQALTERTLHTGHETVLGTPLYMSPEQAQLNNLDVDTRSDIYSLGVLLYELLTGTTPLEKRRFKEAAWDEIRRIISDEEPPRPSTRLSSAEKLPSLAACRQLEPAGLTRLVRGDLDWIVMKALEKQRTRRYETASGFATDVQRYLSGEAVLAAPPSAAYRLRKFVRRHRPQAIAASLVLLALLAGIAGTTWGLVEARRQQRLAEDASDREATRANSEERERMRADEEKQRAIRFRDQALDALRATTGDDVEKLLGSKKGLGAGEREYLEAIVKRWQGFAKQSGTDADTRAYQAEGHFRVAALWQKLGRREDARSEYESACAGWDGLVEQFPGVPTYLQESAKSHLNLGILLAELGKTDRAQKEIRSALAMQTTLVRQHPDEVKYQKLLGSHRYNFGALLFMLGRLDKAQAEFDAARDLQKSLADKFPDEPVFRKNLARTHSNLGVLLVQLGKGAEALVEYQAACNLQKTLALQQPAVPELQVDLADTRNHLGDLFAQLGKLDQARSEHVAAYDLRKALAEQYPAVPAYQIDLAGSCCNIGNLIRAEGKPAECLDWLDQAIRILQQVHEKGSAGALAEEYLRNSHVGRAQAYDQLQKHALAVDDWSRAIQLSPPAERPSLRASRAMSQLQGGKGVEAIAEVSELARSSNWSPGEWYNFACVYSVASAKVADKKQEYAKRAIELLRRAVKAGFDDAALLKRDADLDPLRDHAEFGALVESLSKPPAPSKR